jgi:hypothetical protein
MNGDLESHINSMMEMLATGEALDLLEKAYDQFR